MPTLVYGPDTFTVGADIALPTYAAAWATFAASIDPSVRASTDDLRYNGIGTGARAKWTGTVSADQRIIADIKIGTATQSFPALTVRMGATSLTGYIAQWSSQLGRIELYRVAGSYTLIATLGTVANSTTYTDAYLKATGTGATVTLEFGDATNGFTTFADTNASRFVSGAPGVDIYEGTTGLSSALDNVRIYDEGSSGPTLTFNVTEAADTIVSGLTHGANATFTVTESGDTIVAGATQTTAGRTATFTVTEASDTVVAGLTHGANLTLTVTEASDTVVSGATLAINASLAVAEAADTIVAGATLVSLTNATFNVTEASDTIVSGLTAGENFTLTVTEASDTVVSSLTAGENFTLNVTEASDSIVAGATTVLAGINATFAATEASDTVVAGLSASVTGNVNVTEGSDTAFGFMDTGNPAVVVTTAGAGGGARKKRLYILPDGTRMYATPSEIAQILKLFYQKKPEEKLTKKQKKFADVVFTQDFEPTEKVVPKVYELKPQYKRVQQLDYVAFLETLRKRDEEEFMMMMEVF